MSREFFYFDSFPFAISRTQLGYCAHGPVRNSNSDKSSMQTINSCTCDNSLFLPEERTDININSLDEMIKNYFQIDLLGVYDQKRPENDDNRALNILENRSKRVGSTWETGLLWKRDNELVPDSRDHAKKGFLLLREN